MDEDIFEDLQKLFEECDDVTKSFYSAVENEDSVAESADSKVSTPDKEDSKENYKDSKTDMNIDSNTSQESVKRSWKIKQNDETVTCSKDHNSSEQSSFEEGECTKTFEEDNPSEVLHEKSETVEKSEPNSNYSSFIETSKEDGECSTTSFEEDEEVTVIEISPEKTIELLMESNKENNLLFDLRKENKDFKQGLNDCSYLKKRKRSISDSNENTPKRRHLFISEDVLSPISCVSADKRRNTVEIAETPLIESKFNLQVGNNCSSTPVTTSQKFTFHVSGNCSTPNSSKHTGKQSTQAKKEILKAKDLSDSDSEFQGFNNFEEMDEKEQTVEELIAEITKLCDDEYEAIDSETSDTEEKSDKTLSEIEGSDLRPEWKTRSTCENSTIIEAIGNDDCDSTLTKSIEGHSANEGMKSVVSNAEKHTVLTATGIYQSSTKVKKYVNLSNNETIKELKEPENNKVVTVDISFRDSQDSFSEDTGGRFKEEVTVLRNEADKSNETNRDVIYDEDEHEMQYGEDLLNLDDYDDEGFVDANILEKSHLTKDINLSEKVKTISENNKDITQKGKDTGERKESLFEVVSGLRKDKEDQKKRGEMFVPEKEKKENVKKDTNNVKKEKNETLNDKKQTIKKEKEETVSEGLDYAVFDTSIYRKNVNTAIEREICNRWKTRGSADPDVNLTVATTKRRRYSENGGEAIVGLLEGEQVVCTYLYEEDIVSTFLHYGKTEGQSDLCYMTLENLLNKLYNQQQVLTYMNKQSLLKIKGELQMELLGTKERHREEMEALQYRQAMEDEQFRFSSRHQFNAVHFQHALVQLRQDHIFQQNSLKDHHQNEFCAVRARGMEILNKEVHRHSTQCEPINQLIEQLKKPESHAITSPKKYGPPIVVSLRKGPCKSTEWRHTTIPVCLSAGIAQAVSLEDDLYDHYYGY